MQKLIIDNEFKNLIPALTTEEYNQLESNCIAEGIRDDIIIWDGIIIDGHNRYEIACKHKLEYDTRVADFDNREDVKKWIILNQFGRRNLSLYDRSKLALKLEEHYKAKAKENQSEAGKISQKQGLQISAKAVDTRKEIAKIAHVSGDTIDRVRKIEAKATPEVKEKLKSGVLSINEAFKEIKKEEKSITLENKKQEYLEQSVKQIERKPIINLSNAIEYLKTIKDNSIDLLFTDPPYLTDIEDINKFVSEWLPLAIKKTKQSGRMYICTGAYPEEINAYLKCLLNQDKFIVDNPLIWTYKNTLGVTPKMKYNLNYQMIWHLYSDKSKELDTSITNEMFSVMEINAPDGRQGNRLHTWQKPDELARRIIKHSTQENDLVVDCFACTGTFLLEANRLNRNGIGCDNNKDNLQIAKERGCSIIIGK